MKSEFDREIDALLRRATGDAARREEAARATTVAGEDSAAHMDADELSAYAENALPATARTRYVAHLADCDRCRRLATSIALASNVALKSEEQLDATVTVASETTPAQGWRARLAALFAPRTLGYALPVLAVCVFTLVAFIALRDSGDTQTQLARHDPPNAGTAANANAPFEAASNTTTATANTTSGGTLGSDSNTAAATAQRTSTEASLDRQPDAPAAKPVDESVAVTTQTAPVGPSASPMVGQKQGANDDFSVNYSQEASKVPPPVQMSPPASAANTATNMTGTTATTRNRTDTRTEDRSAPGEADEMAAARARNEASRREQGRAKEEAEGGAAEERAQMMRRGREPDGSRPSARARRSGQAESSPEDAAGMGASRSAAGHRFRRQGGAWVDVRYNDGMSTTSVRRGTEQFRALAADLPELERVANQLGGEVVVVIGNRAYRIR